MPVTRTNHTKLVDAQNYTPSDSTFCPASKVANWFPNAIMINTAGNVVLTLVRDSSDAGLNEGDVTMYELVAGAWYTMPPFKKVKATGTTATAVVVGWAA